MPVTGDTFVPLCFDSLILATFHRYHFVLLSIAIMGLQGRCVELVE